MADSKPPCLTVLGGPMAGNRFVLQDGVANILIGSDPVCAFHLPLPGVSAMHARLSVEPSAVSIWEAGSPRGVHVNDSKVEVSAPLRNGDIVWLGTPGDADVVMLQVILPRMPSLVAASSAAEEAAAEAAAAVEGETVALDPRSMSLEPEAAAPVAEPVNLAQSEPEPEPAAAPLPVDHDTPLAIPFDSPLDAHFASVAPTGEPEEGGVVVVDEGESLVEESSETLIAAPVMAAHDFVLADEGMPLTVQEPASSFSLPPVAPPPPPPPAPKAPIATPPGFEDETEDKLVDAATVMVPAEPHVIEPTAYLPESDFTMPPTPIAPAKATPPAPAPPAAAKPAPPARPVTRPAAAPAPAPRKPGPSVSQRTEPAERPVAEPAPKAKAGSSSSTGLYVGIGIGALVVLGVGGFALMKLMGGKEPVVSQAIPPPVAPTAAPTQAPAATPPPVVEATPEPVGAQTPAPVVPTPTPVPTPTGKPTPSPSPTKAGATPTPTPAAVATPAGPSAEQVRAQQVASLLTQAETALGARQYDQAIAHFDEVLKLDPGNAKASSDRATAVTARDAGRKRFVPGRTVVATEKAAGGGISGFEGAAVQKAPDFLGRIEFEMSPASGLKPGDPWTLKVFVVNDGKKAIRITDLAATTVVNGERSGGAAGAKAREVAPQARVQVGEMAGAWKDATQTWSAEVLLTAKGDSLKNTLTWK
jgi:hypothetical protein